MKNIDSLSHVTGRSIYVEDLADIEGTLHGVVLLSENAHANIANISYPTLDSDCFIIDRNNIPGENQVGGIISDEPLFAENEVHYHGQPIALIVAPSKIQALKIRKQCSIVYIDKKVITDPRVSVKEDQLIHPPRSFVLGDVSSAWDECDEIVEDRVDIGGQEHLYIETHGVYSMPTETGLKIVSSTQGPTAVQKTISRVLDLPMHKIEVEVRRIGGGFGGKEDQASPIAAMAALGTYVTGKPVKLIIDRQDDIKMTGKRHPYSADYKLGIKGGKLHSYEVTFYQNAGAAADLSPAVLERTLFHATNSYFIPHVNATAYCCRTNLPPNTAFRGFGGPQGMFAIESAIHRLAIACGLSAGDIQSSNLLIDGDEMPYGQMMEDVSLGTAWEKLATKIDTSEIERFNAENRFIKRGLATMPITFGISFTNTSMNQAGALVNIYLDGSVTVSTGAVEMGQGVNTRILQTVSNFFSLPEDRIKMDTTNTSRVINTSPSAASATHDLNGRATLDACRKLGDRLRDLAASILGSDSDSIGFNSGRITIDGTTTELSWEMLVNQAYLSRVDLSAHGFYKTPKIYFDKSKEKGHPFAYHTFGVAAITAELDCLRGTYKITDAKIVHDSGSSFNSILDLGQVEGALVQGLGYVLLEDLVYDDRGVLRSNTLSTYKVPDINFAPKIDVEFIGDDNPLGLMGSKAVGEPPLMYGLAGYFAVCNAIRAFTADGCNYISPLTHERVLLALYGERS